MVIPFLIRAGQKAESTATRRESSRLGLRIGPQGLHRLGHNTRNWSPEPLLGLGGRNVVGAVKSVLWIGLVRVIWE